MKKVNILGTEYEIIIDAPEELLPPDSDGAMDHSTKKIAIAKFEADEYRAAPLTESKIDELFSNFWAVAENFRNQYCGLQELLEAEKNVFTPEPNGTSATGEAIATAAQS